MFADSTVNWPDVFKLLASAGSLIVTLYFWLIRANRERVSVAMYPAGGFEGTLESGGIGVWTGKIFVVNRSILATAIISGEVELFWKGRWRPGRLYPGDGCELPWNLPPAQAFAKTVSGAFDVGETTPREQIYASRRLRFTFTTVEGVRVTAEMASDAVTAAAA